MQCGAGKSPPPPTYSNTLGEATGQRLRPSMSESYLITTPRHQPNTTQHAVTGGTPTVPQDSQIDKARRRSIRGPTRPRWWRATSSECAAAACATECQRCCPCRCRLCSCPTPLAIPRYHFERRGPRLFISKAPPERNCVSQKWGREVGQPL